MGEYAWQLALIAGLLLINALFSGSEMALVSLREGQLRRLARASAGGRMLARLARDPNRYLATIQIGITLAGFLASAVAAVSLAGPLVPRLGFLRSWAEPAAIVLVTAGLTFLTLVIGELAPKRLALQHPEGWALAAARPLSALAVACWPAVWLLGVTTDLVVRLTGAKPQNVRREVTPEEIRDLAAAEQLLNVQQRAIIDGAFQITERTLRTVVVPRQQVVSLPYDLPAGEGMRRLSASGHSRAPVTDHGGLDEVLGIVHLRDLVDATGTVATQVRPARLLPESLTLSDALRHLRGQKQHMAFVVDEHSGVEGIVTLEDLVEEVVGEIYSDFDPDVQEVTEQPDGVMLLPGTFPLHDLPDLGVHLPDPDRHGPYVTIAGLLLARLGHLPTRSGEQVVLGRYLAEVREITGHAITQVCLRPTLESVGCARPAGPHDRPESAARRHRAGSAH